MNLPNAVSKWLKTIYNPTYSWADNLFSCWMALTHMTEDFVLLNGDTLFEAAVLNGLLENPFKPVTLVTDEKNLYDADDMKVAVSGGRIMRVGKDLQASEVSGEAIGMIRFAGSGPALFRDMLASLINTRHGAHLWYLSAVDALARARQVDVRSISGLSWCEIDERADLVRAQTVVGDWYPYAFSDVGTRPAGAL